MSGLVFSFTTALPATARLLVFTLIHFLAFGIVGVVTESLLARLRVAPRLFMGVLLGFLLFDLVFYGSVVGLGVDIVSQLGWPAVLAANIVACIALFAYLKRAHGMEVFEVGTVLSQNIILKQGLIAGLLGGSVVAIWFLVLDAIQKPLFYTPAALGSALFFGASQAGDVMLRADVVIGYTFVHFAAFFLIGLAAARFTNEAERNPHVLLGLVLCFVTLEVASIGVLSLMASWLFETVAWWSPTIANLLAAAVMAGYLFREHPLLREQLTRPIEEEVATVG